MAINVWAAPRVVTLPLRLSRHIGPVAPVFATAQLGAGDEVDGDVVLKHRDVGVGADLAGQRSWTARPVASAT